MQLVTNTPFDAGKFVRAGLWVLGAGFASLAASIVASGIDYIQWEKSGALYARTPDAIVAWHALSLVIMVVGAALVVYGYLKGRASR